MNQDIVLSKDIRTLRKVNGSGLNHTGESFRRNTRVVIGEPCFLKYNGRSELVVPVIDSDVFLFVMEINNIHLRRLHD